MRVFLGAGDDARLVVSRQSHRLRLVELGILKRSHAQQPVAKTRRQAILRDVDLVSEDQFERLWQLAYNRAPLFDDVTAAPSTVPVRRPPRREAHANDTSPSFRIAHDLFETSHAQYAPSVERKAH